MEESLNSFIDSVKKSFMRVKEHISVVESETVVNRAEISKINEKLNEISSKINKLLEIKENKPEIPTAGSSSTGNKGVLGIHSFNSYSFNNYSTVMHSKNLPDFSKDLQELFGSLTSQEFLVFLTIYQLEDDTKNVRYIDISNKLSLSEGCIRTYIASLIKKGVPVHKTRLNNRLILLSVRKEFRELNLKQKLANMYYNLDPEQEKLSDRL